LRKIDLRPALILSLALLVMPAAAHADCTADLAKAGVDAKSHGLDTQNNPRAKALMDKANKSAKNHNDHDCNDAVKGLNQLAGVMP
jgi:hypothetical protein